MECIIWRFAPRTSRQQIEFFTQVVGAELVALYWMHGVDNTFHGFLKLSDSSSIAFVQHPDIAKISRSRASRTPAPPTRNVAPGVMQHLALNVDTEADLLAIRDRVRAHGNWIMGPLDHGFLQIDLPGRARGHHARILDLGGQLRSMPRRGSIPRCRRWRESAPTISTLQAAASFESKGGKIAQPKPDPSKPLMQFPPDDRDLDDAATKKSPAA